MKKTNKGRVTLKTIADELDLSTSAVSAILNDDPGCFASQKTKEKVIETADALGYKPNIIARSLRSRKTHTIALIATNLKENVVLSDIELIESLAWEKGYNLLIGYSNSLMEKEEALLEEFYSRNVDGIILIPSGRRSKNIFLKKLIDQSFPIIAITCLEGLDIDFITTDYETGGIKATEHLIGSGRENIAFFGGQPEYYTVKKRLEGYRKAMKRHKITCTEYLPLPDSERNKSFEDICRIAEETLARESFPAGFFATNDLYALTLIRSALKMGLQIPDDLAVVGFDDSDLCSFSPVPITSIRQDTEKISEMAFNALLAKIEKKEQGPVRVTLEPELVLRESTVKSRSAGPQ